MEAPDYRVGAHFEALVEGVVLAALESTGYFFPISMSLQVQCVHYTVSRSASGEYVSGEISEISIFDVIVRICK